MIDAASRARHDWNEKIRLFIKYQYILGEDHLIKRLGLLEWQIEHLRRITQDYTEDTK